jgi:hypothetical protein
MVVSLQAVVVIVAVCVCWAHRRSATRMRKAFDEQHCQVCHIGHVAIPQPTLQAEVQTPAPVARFLPAEESSRGLEPARTLSIPRAPPASLTLYIQDTITKERWSFNLGIRGDLYNGLFRAQQAEPRLGIAYNIKPGSTVLRVSLRKNHGDSVQRKPGALKQGMPRHRCRRHPRLFSGGRFPAHQERSGPTTTRSLTRGPTYSTSRGCAGAVDPMFLLDWREI